MKKASPLSRRLPVATALLLAAALSLGACAQMRPVGDDGLLITSIYTPHPNYNYPAGRGFNR
jgi:type IV pilus biogenesis protein CpaD/CtpE